MSQIFKENIPLLTKASGTTITLATTYQGKTPRVTVGGRQYTFTSTITLNTATTGLNGLDTGTLASNSLYYIYAVRSTSAGFGLVASLAAPTTGPTGFTGWKEIGRFRTLVGSAAIAIVVNRLIGNNLMPGASEGGPITEWVQYTPTLKGSISDPTVGTGGLAIGWYRRVLGNMEVEVGFKTGTSPSLGSGSYYATLPLSLSIDFVNMLDGADGLGNFLGQGSGMWNNSGVGSAGISPFTNGVTHGIFFKDCLTGSDIGTSAPVASWWNNSGTGVTIHARTSLSIAEFAGLWT
jgi:hypothetical protein